MSHELRKGERGEVGGAKQCGAVWGSSGMREEPRWPARTRLRMLWRLSVGLRLPHTTHSSDQNTQSGHNRLVAGET